MHTYTKAISLSHWYFILLKTLPKIDNAWGYLYKEYEFTFKVYVRKNLTEDGLVPVRFICDHETIWKEIQQELKRYEGNQSLDLIFYDMDDVDNDYALIFGGANGDIFTLQHPI